MTSKYELTHETLTSILAYDPISGEFTWKDNRNGAVKIGSKAGHTRHDGYLIFTMQSKMSGIKARTYLGHRLAWFYVHGRWPVNYIDHIDGNPANNAICNLREATCSQNMMNMAIPPNNTSGVKGVSFSRRFGVWEAYITVDRKRKKLGNHKAFDDAVAARKRAEAELFGEFARAA